MKRSRLRSISPKRRRDAKARAAVREAVFHRDGACLLSPWAGRNLHGRDWGPCFGDPFTPHHLVKPHDGGQYVEDNLITLCAGHNDMVEDWPEAAAMAGLVDRGDQIIRGCTPVGFADCPHDSGVYKDGIHARCNECDEIAPWSRR